MIHPSLRRLLAASLPAAAVIVAAACTSADYGAFKTGELGRLAERRAFDDELVASCGSGEPTLAGMALLRRRPYLQAVSDRAASVVWTAAAGAGATVVVTTPAGAEIARADASIVPTQQLSGAEQRLAAVEGLTPGAIHCYALERHGEALTAKAGFRAAPAPRARGAAVRFVAFGDSGDGSDGQLRVRDQMGTVPFDLMLIAGDLAYDEGKLSEIESHFFSVYPAMLRSVPVFPATGNHDYATLDAAAFREVFHLPHNGGPGGEERWYSFDWGDVHFVALDTERTGAAQAAWLDADLSATDRPWTIVYAHRAPYSSGSHGSDVAFRTFFGPVLEEHDVPLVLTGHDHHYERTRPIRGVTYVVTGGGGRGTRETGESGFTVFSESVLHFVYVTVEGSELRLHAIDALGREFDSLAISR